MSIIRSPELAIPSRRLALTDSPRTGAYFRNVPKSIQMKIRLVSAVTKVR